MGEQINIYDKVGDTGLIQGERVPIGQSFQPIEVPVFDYVPP